MDKALRHSVSFHNFHGREKQGRTDGASRIPVQYRRVEACTLHGIVNGVENPVLFLQRQMTRTSSVNRQQQTMSKASRGYSFSPQSACHPPVVDGSLPTRRCSPNSKPRLDDTVQYFKSVCCTKCRSFVSCATVPYTLRRLRYCMINTVL